MPSFGYPATMCQEVRRVTSIIGALENKKCRRRLKRLRLF